MKYLMIALVTMMSTSALAQEVPKYLKDGKITVTLKNGKTYEYSANEYMVVKRKDKATPTKIVAAAPVVTDEGTKVVRSEPAEQKRHKHIVSVEAMNSQRGLRSSTSPNMVDVETKREFGLGLQYQNNFYKDLYLGGRIDTNGGAGVNLGLGF